MTDTKLECQDGPSGCGGEVEMRVTSDRALTDMRAYPRCESHFAIREEHAQRSIRDGMFSDTPPDWFDPSYAGERWTED